MSDKLKDLVEKRNDVDFEAYNLLREMEQDGALTVECILHGLFRDPDLDRAEAKEMAKHYVETFAGLVKKRRALDQAIVRASVPQEAS
jgi:hypothetical protein